MNVAQRVKLFGWDNCIVLSNGSTKLVVTTDVGPRIVWAGHVDDEIILGNSVFGGFPKQLGKSHEESFQFRTGHRFWAAPEEEGPKTYDWDNESLTDYRFTKERGELELIQCVNAAGFVKTMTVKQGRDGDLWIAHILKNMGQIAAVVASWGLSGMALNGTAIIPRPKFQHHPAFVRPRAPVEEVGGFLAAQNMSIWPYTNFQDPRLTLGRKFIFLRQDPGVQKHNVNKIGLSDVHWVAYLVKTQAGARLFIKRMFFEAGQQHTYPDRGVMFETFVCKFFLELEDLGPMENLLPGQSATPLVDRWSVHKVQRMPGKLTDGWVEDNVLPLVGFTRGT
jgi:hypothetical protein